MVMEGISTQTVLLSLISSFIAGLCLHKYFKYRENNIRKKIEDLNSQEAYLEKLAKGNIKLLRSSLFLVFIMFIVFSVSLSGVITAIYLGSESAIYSYLLGVSVWLLLTGAGLCFYQAKAIVQSADLKTAKMGIQKQREKLENKIS
jgi:uncharacterized membrane protein YqjE